MTTDDVQQPDPPDPLRQLAEAAAAQLAGGQEPGAVAALAAEIATCERTALALGRAVGNALVAYLDRQPR